MNELKTGILIKLSKIKYFKEWIAYDNLIVLFLNVYTKSKLNYRHGDIKTIQSLYYNIMKFVPVHCWKIPDKPWVFKNVWKQISCSKNPLEKIYWTNIKVFTGNTFLSAIIFCNQFWKSWLVLTPQCCG